MDKKVTTTVIALVVVLVVAVGGYFVLKKPSTPTVTTTTHTTTSTKSSTSTSSNAIILTKTSSSVGQYLAASNGMTLYTYSLDSTGKSNCTSGCLAAWPAYVATSSSASLPTNVATITRSDNGQLQYTYKGMPLYFYAGDKSAGQMTGSSIPDWAVAKP